VIFFLAVEEHVFRRIFHIGCHLDPSLITELKMANSNSQETLSWGKQHQQTTVIETHLHKR
jgi:hypothetical protein